MLVSVDPGVNGFGLAYWGDKGELLEATYKDVAAPSLMKSFAGIDAMAIEIPQVYKQRLLKGDPNDLIEVAFMAGRLSTLARKYVLYRPREWKGQVPKKVAHPRYLSKLTPQERTKIYPVPKSLIHNVYDAIGIGLYHLKVTGVRK